VTGTRKRNDVYVYGVTAFPFKPRSLGQGIGDPPADVFLVPYRRLAGVVSKVDGFFSDSGKALRKNLTAHLGVLSHLFEKATILPAAFGSICPAASVKEHLAASYNSLVESLTELDGKLEVRLSASYREKELLKAVIDSEPRLARGNHRTLGDKIEHGKEIIGAIERKRENDRRAIFARLEPLLRDLAVHSEDSTVLFRASVLIAREDLAQFDHFLEEIARDLGQLIDFRCVGPLPPYSFVKEALFLSKEAAWA